MDINSFYSGGALLVVNFEFCSKRDEFRIQNHEFAGNYIIAGIRVVHSVRDVFVEERSAPASK